MQDSSWSDSIVERWGDEWAKWKTKLYFMRVEFVPIYAKLLKLNQILFSSKTEDSKISLANLDESAVKFFELIESQYEIYEKQVNWVEQGYWIILLKDITQQRLVDRIQEWRSKGGELDFTEGNKLDKFFELVKLRSDLINGSVYDEKVIQFIEDRCNSFGFSIKLEVLNGDSKISVNVINSNFVKDANLIKDLDKELLGMGWKVKN